MSAVKASLIALKIGDGEMSETFTEIGGFRRYDMRINQQLIDTTDMEDGAWRVVHTHAGLRSMRINGVGIFTNSNTEQQLMDATITGTIANYQCCFASGDIIEGPFLIEEYYRGGDIEGEEVFRVTLESAGELEFIPA